MCETENGMMDNSRRRDHFMRITERHTFFFTDRDVFSNWYRADFTIRGITFNCNEQLMMFCKAKLFGDQEAADRILAETNPKKQKALGRSVRGFDQAEWGKRCTGYVKAGARAKFTQHEDLYDALMQTSGTKLVEASPFDRIWGIGLAQDAPGVDDERTWRGANKLGEVLTELRNELAALPRPVFPEKRRGPTVTG
jgi:ribA/ribD-fused uncharacterized protein